ncbi:MAG: hypothetical protein HOV79_05345 [Hamadaea sp.]|nr:hypothetical protein [Hamadaea sp.]
MERGEIWWASVGERCPVVILSAEATSDIQAMQIVAPAAAEEKHGFVVLSGEEAEDPATMRQIISSAGQGVRGVGIEIEIGAAEGLPYDGVVRMALPDGDRIFCTWLVTLTGASLLERVGTLPSTKIDQLTNALRLAGIDSLLPAEMRFS